MGVRVQATAGKKDPPVLDPRGCGRSELLELLDKTTAPAAHLKRRYARKLR